MTNNELKVALDLIDEGCARLFGTDYRDIVEQRDRISDALDALWDILHEAENTPYRPADPLVRAMFGTGEE